MDIGKMGLRTTRPFEALAPIVSKAGNRSDPVSAKKSDFFLQLPSDLRNVILSYLNYRSLLVFEGAAKAHAAMTDFAWGELRKKDSYLADWQMCEKELSKHKWNYCLGACLDRFVVTDLTALAKIKKGHILIPAVSKVVNRFEGIMARFPFLTLYIILKVNLVAPMMNPPWKRDMDGLGYENQRLPMGWGGELMLQGLIEWASVTRVNSIVGESYFEAAIEKDATQTLLLCSVLGAISSHPFTIRLEQQVWKKKDVTTLNKYEKWKAQGQVRNSNLHESSAVEPYRRPTSPDEIGLAGILRYRSQNANGAEQLLDQALVAYGEEEVPAFTLYFAGRAKYEVGKYSEADHLFTRVTKFFGQNVPLMLLGIAGKTKQLLKDYIEADRLLTRTIEIYGQDAPHSYLYIAAVAKMSLKQFSAADGLLTRAISCNGENPPSDYLDASAKVKLHLGQNWDADRLFKRAVTAGGELNVTADTLSARGCTKFHLQEYKEADRLFILAIGAFGKKVPPELWYNAGRVKQLLTNYRAAVQFYTRAIAAYGPEVPHYVLESAAKAKALLFLV